MQAKYEERARSAARGVALPPAVADLTIIRRPKQVIFCVPPVPIGFIAAVICLTLLTGGILVAWKSPGHLAVALIGISLGGAAVLSVLAIINAVSAKMPPHSTIESGSVTNYLGQVVRLRDVDVVADVFYQLESYGRIRWRRVVLLLSANGDCIPIAAQAAAPSATITPSTNSIGAAMGKPAFRMTLD